MKKNYNKTRWIVHRLAKPRDGTGFSMLEAVVVVGVLLALAVGGLFAYGPITENAKIAKAKSAASEVYTAVMVSVIDGDPTTNSQNVVDAYNSSQNKIKVEVLQGVVQPAVAAMSTVDYAPQSDNDFCVKATIVADASIFAEMGNCSDPVAESTPNPTASTTPTPTETTPSASATPSPSATATTTPEPSPTAATAPAPASYVDPTPTKTILTYKCDAGTSGNFPFNTMSQGTLTIAGSDGSKIEKVYTNIQYTDSTALKAGVTYTVTFDGKYNWLYQGGSPIASCIRSLDHWGEQSGVNKAQYGLQNAYNLTSVPEHIPSTVTDLYGFFSGAEIINDANISKWDVSNVTSFNRAFLGAYKFNQNLNNWNISKATTIEYMFGNAKLYDQPMDKWDTSNLTNMKNVFTGATSFNQSLNSWKVDNVTDMTELFYNAEKYNQPLNTWNVSNVTTMKGMFRGTYAFNQDIGTWRPSKVRDISYMFTGNTVFRYDLSAWTFTVSPAKTSWAPTGFPTAYYPKF